MPGTILFEWFLGNMFFQSSTFDPNFWLKSNSLWPGVLSNWTCKTGGGSLKAEHSLQHNWNTHRTAYDSWRIVAKISGNDQLRFWLVDNITFNEFFWIIVVHYVPRVGSNSQFQQIVKAKWQFLGPQWC